MKVLCIRCQCMLCCSAGIHPNCDQNQRVKDVTFWSENFLSPKTKERGGNLAALLSLAKLLPLFTCSQKM